MSARALTRSAEPTDEQRRRAYEILLCSESFLYFVVAYCHVKDEQAKAWVPFRIWKAQKDVCDALVAHRLVIILKARQLGMTWLVLAYALWLMLFRPAATVLVFSRRDDEAIVMLGERLKGMHSRLPAWMRAKAVTKDSGHVWMMANGSVAYAFPTTGGDSYTASLAIVDEADLQPALGKLMTSVKPTIDGGGQMVLLSRADKHKPQSEFKQIYRAAKERLNGWFAIFLPWWSRPGRTKEWYEAQKADVLYRTGALDDLHEQYPSTDTEALAPRTLDKRIAPVWIEQCYQQQSPIAFSTIQARNEAQPPAIPGLRIYVTPQARRYVIGADPAEGNPTSDPSALTVLDAISGEEVAKLAGQFQPSTFGAHINALGMYFNGADVLVERNNHGHAVLLWLRDHSRLKRLAGEDGREGWLSNSNGKALLYSDAADAFRDKNTVLHSFSTYTQLASIEGSTLRAPEGEYDDEADGYALAIVARRLKSATLKASANPFF